MIYVKSVSKSEPIANLYPINLTIKITYGLCILKAILTEQVQRLNGYDFHIF